MSRSIAAVLWDMDGTLVDSEPLWIAAEIALVVEHGGTFDYADGLALVGADMAVTARRLQERGVALTFAAIDDRLTREVTARLSERVPWRPGARELVRALRDAGIPQAIVTTSAHSMARIVADALPTGSIRTIVAGEDVAHGKPDPEPYLTAATRLAVTASDCIAIEDSPTGLAAAIAAGTSAIGVPNDTVLDNPAPWTRLDTLAGVTLDQLREFVGVPGGGRAS